MNRKQTVLRNRVKQLRTKLKMRQKDLAREVGVARQTIISIEQERLNPSITICLSLAKALREPVDYVFYLDHQTAEAPPVDVKKNVGAGDKTGKRRSTDQDESINPQSFFDFSQ